MRAAPSFELRRVHSFRDDALGDLDGVGVAARIRSKEVTAREVIAAAIERARAVEPHLRAIASEGFEQALETAKKATLRGPFVGVPTFLKDNTDLRGLPTHHGSRAVSGRPATKNAAFTRQFLAQGFVCLGKSKLPEFGLNATTEYAHVHFSAARGAEARPFRSLP